MPRHARQKSNSAIYHIILRGINRQQIFEDEEDKDRLIETLQTCKDKSGFRLFAYCLMGNHFHLLLKVEKEDLELIVKRIAGSYAYWYNLKYRRIGHLFQDRFKSEAVEDDRYFFAVLRYIHQNPLKAGLCKEIRTYKYSSYGEYIKGHSGMLEIDYVFSMIDKESFVRFNEEITDIKCFDVENEGARLNDSDAMAILQKVSKCSNASEFQALEIAYRDQFLKELRRNGLSIRQISRLTGVSFGIVRKH